MKISIKNYLTMAALTLVGAIMAGCSSSDDGIDTPPQPENTGKVVTLTTTVGFDDKAGTRALDIDFTNKKAVKTFAEGETMAIIYKNTSGETVKAVSEALKDGDIVTSDDPDENKKSATFTFHLTEAPDKSESVSYIYPAAMANDDGSINHAALYLQQDGTLATLASKYDLATANKPWAGDNLPGATLANQLAILAITLKNDATSGDITGSIKGLTISDGSHTYAVTRSAAAGPIYVAVKPQSSTTFYVTATDGTNAYIKTLTGRDYAASNIYNVSWRMTEVTKSMPLTMEALTAGTIVVNRPRSGMQYSKNGGETKTDMTETTTIDVSKGDKVQFYGYGNSHSYEGTMIAYGSAQVKVYGNIMSLLYEKHFATGTTLWDDYTFYELFRENTMLTDASGLLLPATELADNCYQYMFSDCTNLTAAPAALPATTLAKECYFGMFKGCATLTTAPTLPATELAEGCYNGMFRGCSSLSAVTCLATNISATNCTKGWLNGVASKGTFTKNPSMTGWSTGPSGIPSGWTRVDYVAPTE